MAQRSPWGTCSLTGCDAGAKAENCHVQVQKGARKKKKKKHMIGSYPVHRAETNFTKKCLHLLDTFVPQPVPKKPRLGP